MPSRYIWAPSEIRRRCKLQWLEKEHCVAEAEKFIAEFYWHKFINPAQKNYKFNHVVAFRAAFSGSYLRFFREVRLPRFTCPLAVLRASVRAARLLRQGQLEPLGAPAQRPVDLYRAPSSDTPGVLSIHAREPMVSFLNAMRPYGPTSV